MAVPCLEQHPNCRRTRCQPMQYGWEQVHMDGPLFTGPMLPLIVRTPFSLWNFSNSFLNLGGAFWGLGILPRLRDFPLAAEELSGVLGSCGE